MPKKKKAFIDKKNAQTFQVVHRAARDPLSQVADAPQMVLTPSFTGNDRQKWQREQRKLAKGGTVVNLDAFGGQGGETFGDADEEAYKKDEWERATYGLAEDGYDYSKHMKELGGGAYTGAAHDPYVAQVGEQAEKAAKADEPQKMILLPEAALPSMVYHSHLLDTSEYDLDPEIWAAMEAAENETADDDGWEALEEDFVDKARMEDADEDEEGGGGGGGGGAFDGEEYDLEDDEEFDEVSEDQMYQSIFEWADEDGDTLMSMEEFIRLQESCGNETPDENQWVTMCGALGYVAAEGFPLAGLVKLYEGEGPHGDYYTLLEKGLIEDADGEARERRVTFAGKGAVEGKPTDRGDARLLDEQFDEVEAAYNDDDIGSLDGSDDEDTRGQFDLSAFGSVLDEFIADEEAEKDIAGNVMGNQGEKDYDELDVKAHVLARYGEGAPELPPMADLEITKGIRDEMDGWDVESIVSTYSNTENHPGRIAYKGTGKKKGKRYMGKPENDTTGHGHGTEAVDPTAPAQGDITLSGKSGLPVEFMKQHYGGGGTIAEEEYGSDDEDYEDEEEEAPENKGVARPRHGKESKEDKKARKASVKAERALNRKTKKVLKNAYRKEEIAQEKSMNTGSASYGRTVISIS